MMTDDDLLEYRHLCNPVSVVLVAGATQAMIVDELLKARRVVEAARDVTRDTAPRGRLAALAETVRAYDEQGTPA